METAKRSLRDLEAKLLEREQQLDRKVDVLESKERSLFKTEQDQERREKNIKAEEAEIDAMIRQQHQRRRHRFSWINEWRETLDDRGRAIL